jgi:hypothetical protein
MNAFQVITKQVAEVTERAAGFLVQATSALINTAESLPLDEMSRRLDGALRALRGEEIFQKTSLQIAREMVRSYTFDRETGVSTFTVPASVTDVEAMTVLNQYFRNNLPGFKRDAVNAAGIEWFKKLPQEYPTSCQERDYSQARQITITGVVRGTRGQARTTQADVLKNESLVFADPRDQALAAAIHACKHHGEDVFKHMWVRGCVPGFALYTSRSSGVGINGSHSGNDGDYVAASGSPSPDFKNA